MPTQAAAVYDPKGLEVRLALLGPRKGARVVDRGLAGREILWKDIEKIRISKCKAT